MAPGLVEILLRPWLRPRGTEPFRLPGALAPGGPVLVVDSGDTAELAFHAPVLRALRDGYPEAPLVFLLQPRHVPLVAASGLGQAWRTYEPKSLTPLKPRFLRLLRAARAQRWQTALLLSQSPNRELELLLRSTGAPLRLGPSHPDAWPAVTLEIRRPAVDATYLGDRPAAVLPLLGLTRPIAAPAWPLPEDRVRQARQLVRFNKAKPDNLLVACDPALGKVGAGPSVALLRGLAEQLLGRLSCQILPLSADAAEPRLGELCALLPAVPPALRCADLLETLLILSQCDLLVSGNTDLFHWAVALGVPAVGLFTPADSEEWEPKGRPRAGLARIGAQDRFEFGALLSVLRAAGVQIGGPGARLAGAAAAGGADSIVTADRARGVPEAQ